MVVVVVDNKIDVVDNGVEGVDTIVALDSLLVTFAGARVVFELSASGLIGIAVMSVTFISLILLAMQLLK